MIRLSAYQWRQIFRWLLLAILTIVLTILVVLYMIADPYYMELSISHINEFTSRFEEVRLINSVSCSKIKKKDNDDCIGGLPRMATVIRTLSKRKNFVLINTGNVYYGTTWFATWRGEIIYKLLNTLPFDAHTLGSNEFIMGVKGVLPFIKFAKAPIVICNMDSANDPRVVGLYSGSTVILRDGLKIGVIGVISRQVLEFIDTGNLTFANEVNSIRRETKILAKKGVFTIIIVSHMGYKRDLILAEQVGPEVSVIIGGRRKLLYNSKLSPDGRQSRGPYPTVVNRTDGHHILVVNTAGYARYVGNLTVYYDMQGSVKHYEGNAVFLDRSIREDKDILKKLKDYEINTFIYGSRKIAKVTEDFHHADCFYGECFLGNVFADALVDHFKKRRKQEGSWAYAPIAVLNPGCLDNDLPKGELTYYDLFALFPHGNTACCVTISGVALKKTFEFCTHYDPKPHMNYSRRILQVSGVKVTYNLSKPFGNRVENLETLCQKCKVPKYERFNESKYYRVIMPSYMLGADSGFTMVAENIANLVVGGTDFEVMLEYSLKHRIIKNPPERRTTIVT